MVNNSHSNQWKKANDMYRHVLNEVMEQDTFYFLSVAGRHVLWGETEDALFVWSGEKKTGNDRPDEG